MNQRMFVAVAVMATLLSAIGAWGLNAGLATAIAPDSSPTAAAGGAPATAPAPSPPPRSARVLGVDPYLDGIMRRNLFDVNVIATWAPEPEDDSDQEQLSELEVELIGTAVTEPRTLSSAVIRHTADELARGYSLGDTLFDREIVAIEPRRVTLKRPDGGLEILQIEGEEIERIEPTEPSTTRRSRTGVEQTGENEFTLSRATFDKTISSLDGLSRMGSVMPNLEDGEFNGFKLSSVRRTGVAGKLGLKSGDVLNTVNGATLDSPEAATEAFAGIKGASNFCFGVTRDGSPTELCYEVE